MHIPIRDVEPPTDSGELFTILDLPTWERAFAAASSAGCDYPGEVAGTALRLISHQQLIDKERVDQLVAETLTTCDACWYACSVPGKSV